MKPYNYLTLSLLMGSLLLSCSHEAGEEEEKPVSLLPQIAGVSLTRAGAVTADVRSIGLYAVNAQSGENNYGTCPAGTYGKYTRPDNGSFGPNDATQTIWLNLQKATIFSCYPAPDAAAGNISNYTSDGQPASEAATPIPALKVPVSAITLAPSIPVNATAASLDFALPANDYMYGVAYNASGNGDQGEFTTSQPFADNGHAQNAAGPAVSIGLKHAFSQIRIIIKRSTDYKGSAEITNVSYKCTLPVLQSSTVMQLTDGKLQNLATATEQTYTYNLSGLTTKLTIGTEADANLTITNYALPASQPSTDPEISVTADGKPMTVKAPNHAFDAGLVNTYTVTVKPTGLALTGFNVVQWSDDTNQPGNVDIK